jgi:DNA-binding NarL/FixJ family response regulator
MGIKVFIAEDQQLIRESFVALLSHYSDLTVVGSAATGYETVSQVCKLVPDVVLMDVIMPDVNGIEATLQILEQMPQVKVIALSGYDTRASVINMLNAGARGYMLKSGRSEELVQAIHAVQNGAVYLSPHIARIIVDDYKYLKAAAHEDTSASSLTPREREMLIFLAEGQSVSEIARKLCLDRKTVETHRRHLMTKLHLKNDAGLVKYAIRNGLILLSE